MFELFLTYLKAFGSGVMAGAAYLVGVLQGDQGLGDLTTVQWLGLVLFVGASYGLTAAVPNKNFVRTDRY